MIRIIRKKYVVFLILFLFSTLPYSNTINASIEINDNDTGYVNEYNDVNNNINEPTSQEIQDNSNKDAWAQIIGDYPNGEIDNGFGNPDNVNLRGKTVFTVNNTEYLIFGTGNVEDTPSITKNIKNPLLFATAIALSFSKLSLKSIISDILFSTQQTLDTIVTQNIESVFRSCESEGCEIWCYHPDKGWVQSVGKKDEAKIQCGFNNSKNCELTLLIQFQTESGQNYLYAGTWNPHEGCEVWRTTDPLHNQWEPIISNQDHGLLPNGFGNKNNTAAYSAAILGKWLYIGTMNWEEGCEIWRTDGTIWEMVVGGNSGDDSLSGKPHGFNTENKFFDRNIYAWEMCVYDDSQSENLYVGTFNIGGCELWRTSDGNDWECLIGTSGILKRGIKKVNSPIRTQNYGIRRMAVFNGELYMGTASSPSCQIQYNLKGLTPNKIFSQKMEIINSGFEIWKFDGNDFTKIIGRGILGNSNELPGFNDNTNSYCWSIEVYNNRLYVGTMNAGVYVINITRDISEESYNNFSFKLENTVAQYTNGGGCEIWYSNNGKTWVPLVCDEVKQIDNTSYGNGFDDINNVGARALITYQDSLYVGIMNGIDGCEIWRFNDAYFTGRKDIVKDSVRFNCGKYELYGEIYYPNVENETFPALIFCEGLPAYVDAYSWIPKALAQHGYIVMIFDPPGLGKSEGFFSGRNISIPQLNLFFRFGSFIEAPIQYLMRNWVKATSCALDYLLNESSISYMIDKEKIGLIGHSLGGITVTEVAAKDDRVDAVVALSHGNPFCVGKIEVPIQYIMGDFDVSLYSLPIMNLCYILTSAPKEFVAIRFGTHIGFTNSLGTLCPRPPWQKATIIRYSSAWFDYFLKDNCDAYNIITKKTSYLSNKIGSLYNFCEGNYFLDY